MASVILRAYRFFFARKSLYTLNMLIYRLALRGLGVLNYENDRVSGEMAFLRRYFAGKNNAIILDIGGNAGDYAARIMQIAPTSRVYSFEPHPKTFDQLRATSEKYGFRCLNLGCGSENERRMLFDYADKDGSKHASLYGEVIRDIHGAPASTHWVEIVRVDDFVRKEGLKEIDLLKIDTEGSEFDVLKGCSDFIAQKKIKAIHFEFNEMNIASRVFFKDFWEFLADYEFYRMMPNGLVPIVAYSPLLCEIFAYQNIVALLRREST